MCLVNVYTLTLPHTPPHTHYKQKATVLEEVSPRSYNVQTDEGTIYRRNRRQKTRAYGIKGKRGTSENFHSRIYHLNY